MSKASAGADAIKKSWRDPQPWSAMSLAKLDKPAARAARGIVPDPAAGSQINPANGSTRSEHHAGST